MADGVPDAVEFRMMINNGFFRTGVDRCLIRMVVDRDGGYNETNFSRILDGE